MNDSSAKRKAALWVAVVFVLGLALGSVFGYFYGNRVMASVRTPPAQMSEAQRRAQRVQQLTQELGLSNDQRQQLDTLLERLHGEYKALHDRLHDQADAQMNEAHQKGRDEIRALLTPEQKPKFEEFLKRLDEDRKKNPPPPPPR
jgi:Spy/CpxP family protein refolding chaperone